MNETYKLHFVDFNNPQRSHRVNKYSSKAHATIFNEPEENNCVLV